MALKINNSQLEELIQKLEGDNRKIDEIFSNINSSLAKLDETVWVSREKTKLDNYLESVISESSINLLSSLNECTNLLRGSNETYQDVDTELKTNITNGW